MQAWRDALMHAWSGRDNRWLMWVLWPISLVFASLVAVRWWLYRLGWIRSQTLPVPVVVVGNVLVGGVGKTPITIALVQHLSAKGWRVGVLSRGYGRSPQAPAIQAVTTDSTAHDVGDEPLLIARKCQVPVWVGSERVATARALLAAHPEVQVLVCDDGLQHWSLARDLELCVFDERGVGNGHLLPAGPLREPWPRRAIHAGVPMLVLQTGTLTGASTESPTDASTQPIDSPTLGPHTFAVKRQLSGHAVQANGQTRALQSWQGQSVQALAGIAKPEVFFSQLRAQGLMLSHTQALADHAAMNDLYIDPTLGEVLCTEKDAVKLWARHPEAWAVPLQTTLPTELLAAIDLHLAAARHAKLSSPHGHQTA
jgi:tetraacyldisaccharide 4'-kinase